MNLGSGEFWVDGRGLDDALRRLKKYFTENVQRELKLREGHVDRKKLKRAFALRRLRRKQKKEERKWMT